MSLDASLVIASGALSNVSNQFAVVSQNVANANTTGYATEVATQTNRTADGEGMGVITGATTLAVDDALQGELYQQNGVVAGLQARQTALAGIDAVQGTVAAGTDLSSLVGDLQDAFSTLENDSSSQAQQQQVVTAATKLTNQINALSTAIGTARQNVQDSIVSDVSTLNSTLANIGSLNTQIVDLQAQGESTADLENQRDAEVATLSSLLNIQVCQQSNGALLITTTNGLELSTDASSGPFATSSASLGATSTYANNGAPAVTLGGVDVTTSLTGGALGSEITLRDTTLPTYQAELDEFSETLSTQFSAQGLALFTDGSGNVPTPDGSPTQANYVGYSSVIQVNPAVIATPSLVRDGTTTPSANTTGAAGYTGLITSILDCTFGTLTTPPATTGLGASGTLSAQFSAPDDLADFATDVVTAESQDSNTASNNLTSERSVQTALQTQVSNVSGVSIDDQMSMMVTLQNAYTANARIISAVQAMWDDLTQTSTS
jgi:flagellar hook-associated protein 1 FlgK